MPPEPQPPPTPQPVAPRHHRRVIGLVSAAVVIAAGAGATVTYLVAGGHGESATRPPASAPTTSAAVSAENLVECVNIERAYNAWNSGAPRTAADMAVLNEVTVGMRMDDGEDFLSAVSGYTDQASKALAVAIAEYNVELGLANLQMTLGGEVEAKQAAEVTAAAERLGDEYSRFRAATCS